ncbi:MAG TPA: hypothetical protein VNA89_06410 [Gemmatimonadaceae bacterium]|nr:hypothetical protein [Gemmatimonadaceae bacterium]
MTRAGPGRRLLAGGLVCAVAACGGGGDVAADSSGARAGGMPPPAAATAETATGVTTPAGPDTAAPRLTRLDDALWRRRFELAPDSVCPRVGLWTGCAVMNRLEQAGVVPSVAQRGRRFDWAAEPAMVVELGRGRVVAILYRDREGREGDERRVRGARVSPGSVGGDAFDAASVVASENLIALVFSRSDAQRERVENAIGAGPPQPRPGGGS